MQSGFFEDKKGNIWTSSFTALQLYDRQKDNFTALQLRFNGKKLESGYHIFHFDGNNILWLKIEDTLFQYFIDSEELKKIGNSKGIRFALIDNFQKGIKQIVACPWELDTGFEFFSIGWNNEVLKNNYWQDSLIEKIEVKNTSIQSDSSIYLYTKSGLAHWNPNWKMGSNIIPFAENKNYSASKGSILNKRQLYVPIVNYGIWSFDLIKQRFTHKLDFVDNHAVRNVRVIDIIDKHLWVTKNNQEIAYSYLSSNKFDTPLSILSNKNFEIISIKEDLDNNIWCSTRNDGVYQLNTRNGEIKHHNFSDGYQVELGLSIDMKGRIWRINNEQIGYFNTAKKWKQILKLSDINVYFLTTLDSNRQLVSTSEGLQELVEGKNGTWHLKRSNLSFGHRADYQFIKIYTAPKGKKYLTNNSKILKALLKNGSTRDVKLAGRDVINGISEYPQQEKTWLATTKGLAFWDWELDTIQYDLAFGYDNLNNVTTTSNGNLWITSGNKLLNYNPETNTIFSFQPEDGYIDANFSNYANLKSSDGKIWLGTNNGLVVFHPDSIHPYPIRPRIAIESIKINNEPYELTTNLDIIEKLNLAYFQNNISIEATPIVYYLNQFTQLKYRLVGYDDKWDVVQKGEPIRFSQLKPGMYGLELYGINANGIKGDIREIEINIALPWWQQNWAIALWLTLLGNTIYIGVRIYVNAQLRKERRIFERQQALQQERNRIASELHDDLGAGLSIIRVLSESELINKESKSKNIRRIFQSAGDLLEKMQDIIWAMNAENDTLESLINYIRYYTYDYLDIHQLDCQFQVAPNLPTVIITGKKRRNIVLTTKEVLHNIVKHAKAFTVQIQIEIKNNQLILIIEDDGIGLMIKPGQSKGNGLKSILKRMKEIDGKATFLTKEGTQITFNIQL